MDEGFENVVVVGAAEKILHIILRNVTNLTAFGRKKIRVLSGYGFTVMGTVLGNTSGGPITFGIYVYT